MPIGDWFVLALVSGCIALVAYAATKSRRTSPGTAAASNADERDRK